MELQFLKLLETRKMKFFIGWHFFTLFMALVIGITSGGYNLFFSLLIWTVFIISIYQLKIQGRFYFFATLIISLIEECIVYSFGGGLQGHATSLIDDLVKAMPVFLAMCLGWYYALKTFKFSISDIYILTGLHGIFLEFVVTGSIFDPIIVIFLGGSVFFIYGTIYTSPLFPEPKNQEASLLIIIIIWMMTLVLMILSAIIVEPILSYFLI